MFSTQTVVGFLVFVAGILFILLKLRRWMRILGKILFAKCNVMTLEAFQGLYKPRKAEIFKCLQQMSAKPLKVVEIGAGVGANFEFLPKNADIICLEPNEFTKNILLAKAVDYPDIKVEFKIGVAENLSSIATESVDAVISTHVLCSVSDVNQSLREILRVLKTGGRFIFMEHIEAVKGSRIHFWQHLVKAVWFFVFQGCNITLPTNSNIENAGFSNVVMDIFEFDYQKLKPIMAMVRRHCIGVATK